MKKRQLFLVLNKNGKLIRFNTGASEPLISWSSVNVLEKGDVLALCGDTRGTYHLASENGRQRVCLCNQALVDYICKKFNCARGAKLSAWMGEEDNVLYFGGMQSAKASVYKLDNGYLPVIVDYNKRVGDWAYIHDNWIEFSKEIRTCLPQKISAFRCEAGIVLLDAPDGPLKPEPRREKGNKMLVSKELASYLRSFCGIEGRGKSRGLRMRAAVISGGIILGKTEEDLIAPDLLNLEQLNLDSKSCYLTMGKRGGIYVSSKFKKQMGDTAKLSVWRSKEFLALKPDPNGDINIRSSGYCSQIFSVSLEKLLRTMWPAAKKLYLIGHKNYWVVEEMPELPEKFEKANEHTRWSRAKLNFDECA